MKNNLITRVENYLETGDQASLLDFKNQLHKLNSDEKKDIENLLKESDKILYGDEDVDETKPVVDQEKPKTTEEVLEADEKDAEKVEIPEIFDKNNGADVNSEDIKKDDEFTIDQSPEVKKHRTLGSLFSEDQSVDKSATESPEKKISPMNKTEQVFLMAELRQAIDEYNKIIVEATKIEQDIEKRASEKPITNPHILKIIREAIHPGNNYTGVGIRKLAVLADNIEDEITRKETKEFGSDIEQIEPARQRAIDALEVILQRLDNLSEIETLRLSLGSLVKESEIGSKPSEGEFKADLKADLDAICINRRAEVDEEASEKFIKQSNEVFRKDSIKEAIDSTDVKTKSIDELPNVSPGIVKSVDEIGQENNSKETLGGNKDTKKETSELKEASPTIIDEINEVGQKNDQRTKLATAEKSDKQIDSDIKPDIKEEDNVYDEVVKKSIDDSKEASEITNDTKLPNSADEEAKQPENIIEPKPLPKVPKFEELVKFGSDGEEIVSEEVITPSKEVDLSNPDGNVDLSAKTLASLKSGAGVSRDKDVKGVVNLTPGDLEKTIEISKRTKKNKIIAVKKRLEELKDSKQVSTKHSEDFFISDEKPIKDIDNNPLGKSDVVESNTEGVVQTESEATVPTNIKPDENISASEEMRVTPTVELPKEQELKTTNEVKPVEKIITPEKGLEPVLEAQNNIEVNNNSQPTTTKEEPIAPKNKSLWNLFGLFRSKGDNLNSKDVSLVERKIANIRATQTEQDTIVAEQEQKK